MMRWSLGLNLNRVHVRQLTVSRDYTDVRIADDRNRGQSGSKRPRRLGRFSAVACSAKDYFVAKAGQCPRLRQGHFPTPALYYEACQVAWGVPTGTISISAPSERTKFGSVRPAGWWLYNLGSPWGRTDDGLLA